jgi:hypothetical protein
VLAHADDTGLPSPGESPQGKAGAKFPVTESRVVADSDLSEAECVIFRQWIRLAMFAGV